VGRIRAVRLIVVGALLAGACSRGSGVDVGNGGVLGNEAISVAGAKLTVSSDRDAVTVNGTPLAPSNFLPAKAGDKVTVDGTGSAHVTAESVFEIEALRGAQLTVPDLTQAPLVADLAAGHLFVRLNSAADTTLVVDAGERQFATRSPDAEFGLCQGADGASCLTVIKGSVEWIEGGVTKLYTEGQATFAARGKAPEPTRCADTAAIGAMQRTIRGIDFAGALADIVAKWEPCDGATTTTAPPAAAVILPSAAGMMHVALGTVELGSPDVDADTPNVLAKHTLEGAADYYIEPITVTNALFKAWIVGTAGDDAAAWRRHVPADWLERAPGGAATQSTYADGTADKPIKGVTYETAGAYCASQGKRLATEVEWELAAIGGVLTDLVDESQDWVMDWQKYGAGPADTTGRQVQRGANGTLKADPYYRVFALESADATAAREHARIRCAADQVAVGGRNYPTVLFQDDFNTLAWPKSKDTTFELGYHPENYHLDISNDHAQLAVVRSLAKPLDSGRIDVDAFIERNNTGAGTKRHRFGVIVGTKAGLYSLSVQPDEFDRKSFVACLAPVDPALVAALKLDKEALSADNPGRSGTVGPDGQSYNQDCGLVDDPKPVPVTTIDGPVRLSLVLSDGKLEAWVNEILVITTDKIPSFSIYGFLTQNYERHRSHTHFDRVSITTE
jgi:formylglycine-generating enzyme required for sulfatase activity